MVFGVSSLLVVLVVSDGSILVVLVDGIGPDGVDYGVDGGDCCVKTVILTRFTLLEQSPCHPPSTHDPPTSPSFAFTPSSLPPSIRSLSQS